MLDDANDKIARYAEIKTEIIKLKSEAESIEAELLKAMTADLEDTKYTLSVPDCRLSAV